MSEKQIFIFGAGYSGKAFARANKDAGTILGTTRAADKFEALRQAGIQPLLFDGALTPEIGDALKKTTHLVVSVAPKEAGDPVLNAARGTIAAEMPALEWIAYLSTVGVYGDHGGG
ncbi:MAG: NAD(P)-dependent oxidoreductase, partial [Mesorhizobium sp.]